MFMVRKDDIRDGNNWDDIMVGVGVTNDDCCRSALQGSREEGGGRREHTDLFCTPS